MIMKKCSECSGDGWIGSDSELDPLLAACSICDGEGYIEDKETTKITSDHVEYIIDNSLLDIQTMFDKLTVVACQLPNGFIIVEHSGCIDPANYDHEYGVEQCMKKIKEQIWDYEGYKAHG